MSGMLENLLKNYGSKLSVNGVNKFIRYFGMLAPVGTGVVGTLLLNWKYKQDNMDPAKKKDLIRQEGITQAVNMACHLLSFIGLGAIAKRSLSRVPETVINGQMKELIQTAVMNIGGLIGAAVVRPILGGQILMKLLNREEATQAEKPVIAQVPELRKQNSASNIVKPAPENLQEPAPRRLDVVDRTPAPIPFRQQPQATPLQPSFSQGYYQQPPAMPYYGVYNPSYLSPMQNSFYFH